MMKQKSWFAPVFEEKTSTEFYATADHGGSPCLGREV